jgi:hypothetical protein
MYVEKAKVGGPQLNSANRKSANLQIFEICGFVGPIIFLKLWICDLHAKFLGRLKTFANT